METDDTRLKEEEAREGNALANESPVSMRLLRGSIFNSKHASSWILLSRFTVTIGALDRAIKVHVIGRKLPLHYYVRVHYFRLALVHLDERQIVFVGEGFSYFPCK